MNLEWPFFCVRMIKDLKRKKSIACQWALNSLEKGKGMEWNEKSNGNIWINKEYNM